ncbi:ACT domain-containing protein [Rubrobacter aplysinae]|uniref:ACT domain-containing protein n=1 Tax=Rubrobacter aplysinae TaxID=909625 RepID=UPI00064BC534|nr:ACT domain-containing protein [Rubrobacter aplysinae]
MKSGPGLTLSALDEGFAVCRLDGASRVPEWVLSLDFFSVTRTPQELSIVAPEEAFERARLPAGAKVEGGWACLAVAGPLDFSLVGVLAGLTDALAAAGVSVFAISTYDTDYLLVKEQELARAMEALSAVGHRITAEG